MEVLLRDDALLHACAHCEKCEMVGRPRFERCGACNERVYCGTQVRVPSLLLSLTCITPAIPQCASADSAAHARVCALLRAAKYADAEAIERKHVDGMDWQLRYTSICTRTPLPRFLTLTSPCSPANSYPAELVDYLPGYSYGVHVPPGLAARTPRGAAGPVGRWLR